jgi:hypothetical protein
MASSALIRGVPWRDVPVCRLSRPMQCEPEPSGTEHVKGVLPVDPELKRNAKNVIEKIHQLRDSL